jgi:sensor domain CHASE-containing protein
MSTTPRNLPRFLPTLTEVVHLSDLTRKVVAATPDLEEMVWFVMQRVDLVIERRLREESDVMLRTVVTEKLQTLSARLRTELETVVRQAVSEAMTSQLNQHKSK